jgi:hypothetical protein
LIDSSSLDDAISNLIVPGGVESLGSPDEESMLIYRKPSKINKLFLIRLNELK